jgi:hypothetical protein
VAVVEMVIRLWSRLPREMIKRRSPYVTKDPGHRPAPSPSGNPVRFPTQVDPDSLTPRRHTPPQPLTIRDQTGQPPQRNHQPDPIPTATTPPNPAATTRDGSHRAQTKFKPSEIRQDFRTEHLYGRQRTRTAGPTSTTATNIGPTRLPTTTPGRPASPGGAEPAGDLGGGREHQPAELGDAPPGNPGGRAGDADRAAGHAGVVEDRRSHAADVGLVGRGNERKTDEGCPLASLSVRGLS